MQAYEDIVIYYIHQIVSPKYHTTLSWPCLAASTWAIYEMNLLEYTQNEATGTTTPYEEHRL